MMKIKPIPESLLKRIESLVEKAENNKSAHIVKPEDIRISMINADHQQNLGGWSFESPAGIAIFHKPTGLYVECGKHRSQHKNKAEALGELERLIGLSDSNKLDQEGGLYD